MVWIVAALFVVAAALPIAGILRLLVRANRVVRERQKIVAERGHDDLTFDDLKRPEYGSIIAGPRTKRASLIWDACLIGGGLVIGAVASIWALWV